MVVNSPECAVCSMDIRFNELFLFHPVITQELGPKIKIQGKPSEPPQVNTKKLISVTQIFWGGN